MGRVLWWSRPPRRRSRPARPAPRPSPGKRRRGSPGRLPLRWAPAKHADSDGCRRTSPSPDCSAEWRSPTLERLPPSAGCGFSSKWISERATVVLPMSAQRGSRFSRVNSASAMPDLRGRYPVASTTSVKRIVWSASQWWRGRVGVGLYSSYRSTEIIETLLGTRCEAQPGAEASRAPLHHHCPGTDQNGGTALGEFPD